MKKAVYLLLLLLLGATQTGPMTSAWAAAPGIGDAALEIAAEDWINTDKPVSLATLKGKIVVLEFWATWCPPCLKSIPHLIKMNSEYKDKGVVFVSLTDEDRKKAKVDDFVTRMKMDYIVGTGSQSGTKYGVRGIPHAFVISPEGKVLWKGHPMAGLDKAIEAALAQFPEKGKPDTPEPDTPEKGETVTDEQAQSIGNPLLDNLLEALKKEDYSRYTQDLAPSAKKKIAKEKFGAWSRKISTRLGTVKSRKYVAFLKKKTTDIEKVAHPLLVVLWKANFTKTEEDMLIKLIVGKTGEKYLVRSLTFQ